MNVAQLIDYLQQFDPQTRVVLTEDDVREPGEFLALDTVPLELLSDVEEEESAPATSPSAESVHHCCAGYNNGAGVECDDRCACPDCTTQRTEVHHA